MRRAAGVATFSGWTMVFFAVVTLIGALFGDWVSLALGVGLSMVAYNELRGGSMLRVLDPAGARTLGYNQIVLGILIVVYAVWSLISAAQNPPLAAAGGSTGDPQIDETLGHITNLVTFGLYGGMAVAGAIVPGLTAWYYFSRAQFVRAVLEQTPAWAIDALRAAA